MKRLLLSLLLIPASLGAQERSPASYFRPPMDGTLLPSANFAETRPNHLHSGVDIKTGGVEGRPLYAAADGYISRVNIAPRGFGNTIYITHPNGMMTIYAHMQRFSPAVEKYVREQRYRQKKHAIDLYLGPDVFPVKQGERIGLSGNTGSSAGPHLHYEIRDAATQEPLNPVRLGVVNFKDDIAPTIVKLHHVSVDTVGIVPVSRYAQRGGREAVKGNDGVYTLRDTTSIALAGTSYFVLEVTDRKNDSHNTMGVYRVKATVDGEALFGFELDRFSYTDTKYVNSLCDYKLQRGSRNQLIRLALQANNRLPVYSKMKNRGALVFDDNARHAVRIEVEDDAGNKSVLAFSVHLLPQYAARDHGIPDGAAAVDATRQFNVGAGGARVTIPAGALYENIFLDIHADDEARTKGVKGARYSGIYTIGDPAVPLHKAMNVSIAADSLPAELRTKACLGLVTADGAGLTYAGGTYKDGRVAGNSSVFGRLCVTADRTPPTIVPNFNDGADLRGRSSVSFTVRDNFSGISSFEATIDGQWMILEQQGATLTHHFDPEKIAYANTKHTLRITATDAKGNTATLTRTFVR